jgi:serine/threonine protein kinase
MVRHLIGQSFGRYHVLEQLGEGGMAIVYKAYDTRLETEVAIKVIRTEIILPIALERTLKRFEREAKALARLTHPNIVKVTDYGEYENKPYLVMPLLLGGTLKSKLNGKPVPWQDAIQILIPIADALGYAHKHDIIHRDVKPANILITENGQPMLADFGVAKILDVEETMELTGTGVGIGTPEYMAPEQGSSKVIDQRADIYALGVVFYEMVAGRRPYTADTPLAVLIKRASEPLPRPKQFAPDLPQAVENVIVKSLAKKPEDRYQNMVEFTRALEKLADDKPVAKKIVAPKVKEINKRRAEFKAPAIPRRAAIIAGLIALGIGLFAIFPSLLKALPAALFPTSAPGNAPKPEFTATLSKNSTPDNLPASLFTATAAPLPAGITDAKSVSMRLVPAGTFTMGAVGNEYGEAAPVHEVYLDSYYMDIYEVTNTAYKLCVDAGVCELPENANRYNKLEYAEHPVVYVNWNMANIYCKWRDARLPTEAQWEKAARGVDERTYPWGEGLDCDKANYSNGYKPCVGNTTKAGSYESDKSPYGIYDMAGNVSEWTNDWYGKNYYQNSPSANPLGPASGKVHMARGGSWYGNFDNDTRSAFRGYAEGGGDSGGDSRGFRCARSVESTPASSAAPTQIVTIAQPATKTPDPISQLLTGAFNHIQSSKPAYSFTFDQQGAWNFYLPENVKIADGQLAVVAGLRNNPEYPADHWNAASIRLFTSHAFAVSFDFRIEGTAGQYTDCGFEIADYKANGDIAMRNMYVFAPGNLAQIKRTTDNQNFSTVARVATVNDFTQYTSATIILLDTNSAVFINDKLELVYNEQKDIADFDEFSLSANGTQDGLTCYFDNFEIWDLGSFGK